MAKVFVLFLYSFFLFVFIRRRKCVLARDIFTATGLLGTQCIAAFISLFKIVVDGHVLTRRILFAYESVQATQTQDLTDIYIS